MNNTVILMNLAFVGYEELSRSRRVLSTYAFGLANKNGSAIEVIDGFHTIAAIAG